MTEGQEKNVAAWKTARRHELLLEASCHRDERSTAAIEAVPDGKEKKIAMLKKACSDEALDAIAVERRKAEVQKARDRGEDMHDNHEMAVLTEREEQQMLQAAELTRQASQAKANAATNAQATLAGSRYSSDAGGPKIDCSGPPAPAPAPATLAGSRAACPAHNGIPFQRPPQKLTAGKIVEINTKSRKIHQDPELTHPPDVAAAARRAPSPPGGEGPR